MLLSMNAYFLKPAVNGVSFLRDTKSIGELSELIVGAALVRAGYHVAVPLGENHRYDLIVEKAGTLSRVQVKTGRLRKGAILFNCYSVNSHKAGRLRTYRGSIDFFGVYCPDVKSVYLVPVADVPRNCYGSLRWSPPKNRQHSKIRWAEQYLVSMASLPELVVVGDEAPGGVTLPGSRAPS
jgi:hypothetical protein